MLEFLLSSMQNILQHVKHAFSLGGLGHTPRKF